MISDDGKLFEVATMKPQKSWKIKHENSVEHKHENYIDLLFSR